MRQFDLDSYRGWLDGAYQDFMLADFYADDPKITSARGYCLLMRRDIPAATRFLEGLIEDGYATAQTWHNLAYCYEKSVIEFMQDRDRYFAAMSKAKSAYTTAVNIDDSMAESHLKLAIFAFHRYLEQRADYRSGRGREPAVPLDGLAHARKAIRHREEAYDPYYYGAKLAAAVFALKGGQEFLDESIEYLEEALARGRKANQVKRGNHPFDVIAAHPRFQELAKAEWPDKPIAAMSRTVLPDVMFSQFELDGGIRANATH